MLKPYYLKNTRLNLAFCFVGLSHSCIMDSCPELVNQILIWKRVFLISMVDMFLNFVKNNKMWHFKWHVNYSDISQHKSMQAFHMCCLLMWDVQAFRCKLWILAIIFRLKRYLSFWNFCCLVNRCVVRLVWYMLLFVFIYVRKWHSLIFYLS